MSVLDSVWSILKGNLSLAFYSFTALIGILFGGGTAVLNFILNMVCYFPLPLLPSATPQWSLVFFPWCFLKYLCLPSLEHMQL